MDWTQLAGVTLDKAAPKKLRDEAGELNAEVTAIAAERRKLDSDGAELVDVDVATLTLDQLDLADDVRKRRVVLLQRELLVRRRLAELYRECAPAMTAADAKAHAAHETARAEITDALKALGYSPDQGEPGFLNSFNAAVFRHPKVRAAKGRADELAAWQNHLRNWGKSNSDALLTVETEVRRLLRMPAAAGAS
jgi:hypothetical protein